MSSGEDLLGVRRQVQELAERLPERCVLAIGGQRLAELELPRSSRIFRGETMSALEAFARGMRSAQPSA